MRRMAALGVVLFLVMFGGYRAHALDQVASAVPPVVQGKVEALAVDSSGNRYITGSFGGTVDFNLGVGEDSRTASATSDAFITRYNADGTYAWTQTFGGNEADIAKSIAISGTTVFVCGHFNSTNARIGTSATTVSTSGLTDAFVIALSASNGAPISGFGTGGIRTFGGGSGNDQALSLTVSGTRLFVAGSFGSFNAGIGGSGTLNPIGGTDAVIFSLSTSTGALITTFGQSGFVTFGGNADDRAVRAVVTGTTVLLAGNFSSYGAGYYGFGPLSPLSPSGSGFIAAMNSSTGEPVYAFGDNGAKVIDGEVTNMTASSSSVYVCGRASNSSFVSALNLVDGTGRTGFGNNGRQIFGGTPTENRDVANAALLSGSNIYVTGRFSGRNAGIGGNGSINAVEHDDAYVIALNATSGAAVSTFGNGGVVTFGGDSNDAGQALAISGTTLLCAGLCQSNNAGVNGTSNIDATYFEGFLLGMNASSGQSIPRITSPLVAGAAAGQPFTYTFTASGSATLSVTDLPGELTYSAGVISGTLSYPGTYYVTLEASNAYGKTSAWLIISVVNDFVAEKPIIQGVAQSTAFDSTGNKYVCGAFSGAQDFNPFQGADVKVSIGWQNAFVTRFNADGTYAWTQVFGGSRGDVARAVTVSGSTVLIAGTLSSRNAGVGGPGNVRSFDSDNAFVLALNASTGAPITSFGRGGVQTLGSGSIESKNAIAANSSTVFISGKIGSTSVLVGSSTVVTIPSSGAYVAALSINTGELISTFGTSGIQVFGDFNSSANGLALTANNVYVAGSFQSAVGIGGNWQGISQGYNDAFIAALNISDGSAVSGFGSGGFQTFGGYSDDEASAVVFTNNKLIVSGSFKSTNAGIGGIGNIAADGFQYDAFVLQLDSATGQAVTTFGRSGVQTFGGSSDDFGRGVAVSGTSVCLAGEFYSTNAGVGGSGTVSVDNISNAYIAALDLTTGAAKTNVGQGGVLKYGPENNTSGVSIVGSGSTVHLIGCFTNPTYRGEFLGDQRGFILPLNPSTGASIPQITSPLSTGGIVGTAFKYTLTASGVPSTKAAANLPPGLSFGTGVISGTPTTVGTFPVTLTVSNSFGADVETLMITVIPDGVAQIYPPVIQGQAQAIAVDSAGNQYVTGAFYGIVDFNPGVGGSVKTSAGGYDVFVTRFNADGSYAWTQTFGGSGQDYGRAITISGSTVLVAGSFFSIDAGFGAKGTYRSNSQDAFVIALNASNGSPVTTFGTAGVQRIGGWSNDVAYGISASGTTFYVAGTMENSISIGSGTAVSGSGSQDAFIAALNTTTGAAVAGFGNNGIQTFGGSNYDGAYGIVASSSAVYVSGYFEGRDAGFGGRGTFSTQSDYDRDAFVIALNPSSGAPVTTFGNQGMQKFGGSSYDYATAIAISGSKLYVTGVFYSADAGIGGLGTIRSSGNSDLFVAALSSSTGAALTGFGTSGVKTFGGSGYDSGWGIVASSSNIYLRADVNSTDAGFGAAGGYSLSNPSCWIALNGSSGAAVTTFGTNGIQFLATALQHTGNGLALSGNVLFAVGGFTGTDLGLGNNAGPISATDFGGFMLRLNSTTAKLVPNIRWATPAAVVYGTALSATQLNASANAAGSLSYSPAAGTVLNAGSRTLSVSFTPADTTLYSTTSKSVTLTVNKAPLTITAENQSRPAGQNNPAFSATYSGFVNGDTAASLDTAAVFATTATASSQPGTYPITVNGAADANYAITFVNGTLTVTNVAPAISSNAVTATPNPARTGQTVTLSVTATDADNQPLAYAWNFGDGTSASGATVTHIYSTVGTYTAEVTVTDGFGGSAKGIVAVSVDSSATSSASIRINFQPAGAPIPSGYLADTGAPFGNRGNGQSYGWNIDNSITARDRNSPGSPDQSYDTLQHMQKPENPNAAWEIAVPNGSYSVRVVAGDPSNIDSVYKIQVEGALAISGTPTATRRWLDNSVLVSVNDGRLTISNTSGAINNKLCFVVITPSTTVITRTSTPDADGAPEFTSMSVKSLKFSGKTARLQALIDALPEGFDPRGQQVEADIGGTVASFTANVGSCRMKFNAKSKAWAVTLKLRLPSIGWSDRANAIRKLPVVLRIADQTFGGE